MRNFTVLQKTILSIGLWIAVFMLLPFSLLMAQTTLYFTGKDANGQPVQLDSVRISNVTREWTEVLPASDLVLTMTNTGIVNPIMHSALSQNVPNPFDGVTDVTLKLPKSDFVNMTVYALSGQQVTAFAGKLEAGQHTFRIRLSRPQAYMLKVKSETVTGSIKMLNTGNTGTDRIELVGKGSLNHNHEKSGKGNTDEIFVVGDMMSFVGYSTIGGVSCTSVPVAMPIESSQTIVLQFTRSDSFVCGTTQVFDYENNAYNTVEIGSQCWLKENMRTTHYANGTSIPISTSNSFTDAYCCYPNNDPTTVPVYGLLYNWPAVMEMDLEGGEADVQGVCPDGWHVPCEQEWNNFLWFVEGQSAFQCDSQPDNIGKALASTTGWQSCSSSCTPGYMQATNNATGFSAMPASGYYGYYDNESFGGEALFWSSSESSYQNCAHGHYIDYDRRAFFHWEFVQNYYFSVRCLRDEEYSSPTSSNQPCPQTPTVTDYDGNVYNTVQIGTQCWMKENLKTTHYYDGTLIPIGNGYSNVIGYRYFPENDSANVGAYGCLYNWAAVMNGETPSTSVPSNVQGVCPTGWHVPSNMEWITLTDHIGTQSECQCGHQSTLNAKSLASTSGWLSNAMYCTPGYLPMYNNASGFTALPAGHVYNDGYEWISVEAFFWSSTEYTSDVAGFFNIQSDIPHAEFAGVSKSNAYSVRCLKD